MNPPPDWIPTLPTASSISCISAYFLLLQAAHTHMWNTKAFEAECAADHVGSCSVYFLPALISIIFPAHPKLMPQISAAFSPNASNASRANMVADAFMHVQVVQER